MHHTKHISRDHYPASPFGESVGSTENTASSIVACFTVFSELLPGNALIKSVTILKFRIWVSHSYGYEELDLLGHNAM
jgi:hypothetical protein